MIEGVLQVSEMRVGEIMIPRAQMDVIDINDAPEKFIPYVIETAHSRFPVIDKDRDDVIGILLAKDLLRHYAESDSDIRGMLRPAVFIPESKRLNVLLKEFRSNRNHIAIVVDEYGGVSGLITIEDVMNSEVLAWPVQRLDVSPTSDGAAAVILDPSYVVARVGLARLMRGAKEYAVADEQLREALRWNPSSVEAHMEYARLLHELGKQEQETMHVQAVLRIDPESEEAKELLGNERRKSTVND